MLIAHSCVLFRANSEVRLNIEQNSVCRKNNPIRIAFSHLAWLIEKHPIDIYKQNQKVT